MTKTKLLIKAGQTQTTSCFYLLPHRKQRTNIVHTLKQTHAEVRVHGLFGAVATGMSAACDTPGATATVAGEGIKRNTET